MNCHFLYLKDTPIIIRNQDNITSTFSIVKHKSLFRALLLRTGSAFAKQPNREVPAPLKYFVTEILCHSGTQGRESQVQTQQQSSRLTFDQQSKQSLTQHQTQQLVCTQKFVECYICPFSEKTAISVPPKRWFLILQARNSQHKWMRWGFRAGGTISDMKSSHRTDTKPRHHWQMTWVMAAQLLKSPGFALKDTWNNHDPIFLYIFL